MFKLILTLSLFFVLSNARHPRRPTDSRIIGGDPAEIEDYPYQVSVLFGGRHGCGGSIVNERYILTAAHCTYEETEDNVSVRVGSSIINSGGTVIQVSKIYQHESFNFDTMDYDISVLELTDPLEYSDSVQNIELIGADEEIQTGAEAIATGWGKLYSDGPTPDQLQVVKVPVLSQEQCEKDYGTGPDGVTERMFCAAEEGKDTCQGDSGGPLVVNNILVGITSWGDICGAASTPGVYTKISLFREYIDNIVN